MVTQKLSIARLKQTGPTVSNAKRYLAGPLLYIDM